MAHQVITYRKETWNQFFPQFIHLWNDIHLAESRAPETAEFDKFNEKLYRQAAQAERLYIITARDWDTLIGYFVSYIVEHPNQIGCMCAYTPLYFVHPKYRGKGIGSKLIDLTQESLKVNGAFFWYIEAKTYLPYQSIFEHKQFREIATVMIKEIR